VDLWMASICVAVAEGREVNVPTQTATWRFEYGSRLQGQTAWIDLLQMVAIVHFRNPAVVADSRIVIDLANALAAAGLPSVIQMMTDGYDKPLWNLSMRLMDLVLTVLPDAEESELPDTSL
jgi:hypothetical protein